MLVLYYSSWVTWRRCLCQAEGRRESEGMSVDIKRVSELVPTRSRAVSHKLDKKAPLADPRRARQLRRHHSARRRDSGTFARRLRNCLDQTAAVGEKRTARQGRQRLTCTQSQDGGQEMTITSFHTTLLHHGMVIVGPAHTAPGIMTLKEVEAARPTGAISTPRRATSRAGRPARTRDVPRPGRARRAHRARPRRGTAGGRAMSAASG